MKKLPKIVILLFLFALSSCDEVKEPEFQKIENVKFKSVNLKGDLELTAEAVFYNPNPVGVKITKVDIEVDIEGKDAAHLIQNLSSEMKGNSDFSLPLTIQIPIEKVVRNIKDTVTSIFKKKKYKVEMDGMIEVQVLGQKIEVPIEYSEAIKLPLL